MKKTLERFLNGIEALLSAKLLTADRAIRNFLIIVSEEEPLLTVIKDAGKGFSADEEIYKFLSREKTMPKKPGQAVALVTAMLYRIDGGGIPLVEMLRLLYPDTDREDSFKLFIKEVLHPYLEAFTYFIDGEPQEIVEEPIRANYDKMNDDLRVLINRIAALIGEDSVLQTEVAEEVLSIVYGFSHILPYGDSLLTRVGYLGLKNTMNLYGIRALKELGEINRLLKIYGVL